MLERKIRETGSETQAYRGSQQGYNYIAVWRITRSQTLIRNAVRQFGGR
jgi:hypothetical protein